MKSQQSLYLLTRPVTPEQAEVIFQKLATQGSSFAASLAGHAREFDALTHGHGGWAPERLIETEESLAGALPKGFRVDTVDADLGEHATRAPGSRMVDVSSGEGESCHAEWAGFGMRIALEVRDEVNLNVAFEYCRADLDGRDLFRISPESAPLISVRRGGSRETNRDLDMLRPRRESSKRSYEA